MKCCWAAEKNNIKETRVVNLDGRTEPWWTEVKCHLVLVNTQWKRPNLLFCDIIGGDIICSCYPFVVYLKSIPDDQMIKYSRNDVFIAPQQLSGFCFVFWGGGSAIIKSTSWWLYPNGTQLQNILHNAYFNWALIMA